MRGSSAFSMTCGARRLFWVGDVSRAKFDVSIACGSSALPESDGRLSVSQSARGGPMCQKPERDRGLIGGR